MYKSDARIEEIMKINKMETIVHGISGTDVHLGFAAILSVIQQLFPSWILVLSLIHHEERPCFGDIESPSKAGKMPRAYV